MSNFNLDHIFCFCEPNLADEVKAVNKIGLTLHPGNKHPGQGTANRAVIFEENYLEFIFLESLADAKNNPLKLHKRADWRNTGSSQFGICLRGNISKDEIDQFWEYNPPYWPSGVIYIHKSNEDAPEQPLIFVIPSSSRPADKPNINSVHLTHETASKAIKKIEIVGPNYKWPEIFKPQQIFVSEADHPHMKIIIDGKPLNEIFLNDSLSIVSP